MSQLFPVCAQNVANQRVCCFDHPSRHAETAAEWAPIRLSTQL